MGCQLHKVKREEEESVRDFISQLKHLNSHFLPHERYSNDQLLDRFIHGLKHEAIYNGLVIRDITTCDEVTT